MQNRYHVRIDGQTMPGSYSYKELLLNGILEFDDIEVKEVTKSSWTRISDFYFAEEHEDKILDDSINQSQCNNQNTKPDYEIDDYGQIINHGRSIQTPDNGSSSSSPYSSPRSSSDSDIGCAWLLTIIVLAIVIILFCTEVISISSTWGGFVVVVGCLILCMIWGVD